MSGKSLCDFRVEIRVSELPGMAYEYVVRDGSYNTVMQGHAPPDAANLEAMTSGVLAQLAPIMKFSIMEKEATAKKQAAIDAVGTVADVLGDAPEPEPATPPDTEAPF